MHKAEPSHDNQNVFALAHIEYIIIDSSKRMSSVLKVFKEVAKSTDQYEQLIAKILTTDQIAKDF